MDSSSRLLTRAAAERAALPHRKLQALAERAATIVELAMERVVAHHAEPAKYPLPPSPHCLERVLAKRFAKLSRAKQDAAVTRTMPRVKASSRRRTADLGDLGRVDLSSSTPVVDQVKALPIADSLKISSRELPSILDSVTKQYFPGLDRQVSPSQAGPIATKLDFRLGSVRCINATRFEPGDDDMSIAGIGVDNLGALKTIGPVGIGQFETGRTVIFSPDKTLTTFDLTQGSFPKAFVATPILAEIDFGDFADIVERVGTDVLATAALVVGFGFGTGAFPVALAGTIGMLVGAALVGLGVFWQDDVFIGNDAFPIVVESNALTSGALQRKDLTFEGFGGSYQLSFSFAVRA